MANFPQQQQDFDLWEFISCTRCRMPVFMENSMATVPFWLTECGHIICNNHLNPDQSCAQCGSEGIQLTPLQREIEAPMSEWFQSIPLGLDSIAYAAKFQQDIMASQVRYHKSKHQQLRQLLERLRREVIELKKDNDSLRHENNQYRLQMGHMDNHELTSDNLNSNNKRQMISAQQSEYPSQRPKTNSSSNSITTPLGPQRLTLQPGQPLQGLSSSFRQQHSRHGELPSNNSNDQYLAQSRPQSTRAIEQYAHTLPESSTFHPVQLSYAQNTPRSFQRTDATPRHLPSRSNGLNDVTLPPTSSRFKPVVKPATSFINIATKGHISHQSTMGPPPTPQNTQHGIAGSFGKGALAGVHLQRSNHPSSLSHILPPSSRRESVVTTTPVPGQPLSGVDTQRYFRPGNLSRPSNATSPTAGHRTPFVSRVSQQNGFA